MHVYMYTHTYVWCIYTRVYTHILIYYILHMYMYYSFTYIYLCIQMYISIYTFIYTLRACVCIYTYISILWYRVFPCWKHGIQILSLQGGQSQEKVTVTAWQTVNRASFRRPVGEPGKGHSDHQETTKAFCAGQRVCSQWSRKSHRLLPKWTKSYQEDFILKENIH